jgi:hypothetical protein
MQDFVYQTGKRAGTDLSAYLISVDVFADVSPRQEGQFGLGAGVSLYSGDDPEKDDDSAYDQLFPTLHKFHGYMDRAVVIAGSAGLLDINGKALWEASDKLKLTAAYHAFSTEVDVPLSPARTSKNVGQEIDIVAKGKLTQGLKLELGGAVFFPGDVPKESPEFGDENATWFYLQGVAAI